MGFGDAFPLPSSLLTCFCSSLTSFSELVVAPTSWAGGDWLWGEPGGTNECTLSVNCHEILDNYRDVVDFMGNYNYAYQALCLKHGRPVLLWPATPPGECSGCGLDLRVQLSLHRHVVANGRVLLPSSTLLPFPFILVWTILLIVIFN